MELGGIALTSPNTSMDVALEELAIPFGRADVAAKSSEGIGSR